MAMNTHEMGMNGIVRSGGEKKKQWRFFREKEHDSEGLLVSLSNYYRTRKNVKKITSALAQVFFESFYK